ncbi:hypothetical protein KJ359_004240 [Pestalotiopsis sp. 9143b]|nr:hypothetical protein KJ359_004240 [Pestalotiopsis sp. 9143b]
MSAMKRALLIASPFQGLRGPLNDVKIIEDVLANQGFDISTCCGEEATRQGILEAWNRIIDVTTSTDDTVVIYYSGHGGIVEDSTKNIGKRQDVSAAQQPWRYQFLVPVDFRSNPQNDDNANEEHPFTGILDVELAHLLRATTNRTHNVTVILDCCHSGRMARDPSHPDDAMPRNLPEVEHAAIAKHIARLRAEGQIPKEALHIEDNKYAVRIAAAASKETAWEYRAQSGQWIGRMTQALSSALREAWQSENKISWRTTLLRVRELVNIDFSQQNPQVEGPDTRLLFSLEKSATNALVLEPTRGEFGIIQAGRVSGVRENNVYALMPFGAERPSEKGQIGTATVKKVIGSKAQAEISMAPGRGSLPKEGVLAFLLSEALYEWPVAFPEQLHSLPDAIDESKYLRRRDPNDDSSSLVTFWQDGDDLILSNSQGVQVASQHISDNEASSWTNASQFLVKKAEQLAKAQHLQTLACEEKEELKHNLAVTLGTVKNGESDRIIENDGNGFIIENDRIYISLQNRGDRTLYISVFDINVAGQISLVSSNHPEGIELPSKQSQILGANKFGWGLKGLAVSWTGEVPKIQPISERLVFILTEYPVDLQCLADNNIARYPGYADVSSLERLAFSVATGAQRDMASESRSIHHRYNTLHIPLMLRPRELQVEELPTPKEVSQRQEPTPATDLFLCLEDQVSDDLSNPMSQVLDVLSYLGPEQHIIEVSVQRDLQDFVSRGLDGLQELATVLTITGQPDASYINSCENYIKSTWSGNSLIIGFFQAFVQSKLDFSVVTSKYASHRSDLN